MNDADIYKLNELITNNFHEFSEDDLVLRLVESDELIGELKSLSIDYDTNRYVELQLKIESLHIFYGIDDFKTRVISSEINFLNDSLLIVRPSPDESLIFCNQQLSTSDSDLSHLIDATISYIEFRDFLIKLAKDDQLNDGFLEYYNPSNNEILISSYSDIARISVKLSKKIPELDFTKSYSQSVNKFVKSFSSESKHFPTFIKSELISYLKSEKAEERINKWFAYFDQILDSAQLNFNVYLNSLSIETIKQEYQEYKNKYFESYSLIGNKISNQIFALPITVIGLGIGIERLNDTLTLIPLAVVTVIFSVFIGALTYYFRGDLKFLSSGFSRDYDKMVSNLFFIDHPEELDHFSEIKQSFDQKSRSLDDYLIIYCFLSFMLYDFLSYLALSRAGVGIIITLILLLVILFVQILFFSIYLDRRSPKK